jgi:hypothetical protein
MELCDKLQDLIDEYKTKSKVTDGIDDQELFWDLIKEIEDILEKNNIPD